MISNDPGRMVESEWMALKNRFPNIELHEWVVMPNHFHGIIEITYKYSAVSSDGISITTTNVGAPLVGAPQRYNEGYINAIMGAHEGRPNRDRPNEGRYNRRVQIDYNGSLYSRGKK
jgi:hypothetical protein